MNIFLRFTVWILLVSLGCAGAIALITAKIWVRLVETFENRVEREVNRRLRHAVFVPRFNVHMDVVEDKLGYDEETEEM